MTDEAKLKILIEAQNRAKGAFDEANGQLEKTQSRFDGINEKLDRVGSRMKDVGGKMSATLTLPILAGAGLSVKAFSDLQETLNKVDVSFGSNSATVKAWAQDSIKSMGLARQSALDATALFGDMGTGMGQTQAEAAKMSMGLTQLGADMASFKNVSFERAQTALAGIYTGETEALKGLGIVMTQTNLEEFARAKGINKSMQEMSQAELVQLRYNYVMDKTKNAQGDFARTSDGIANRTRIQAERTKELSAQFGEKLAPAYNKVLDAGGKILDFFNGLSDGQQKALLIAVGVVAALGPLIMVIGHLITVVKALNVAFMFLAANPIVLAITAIILVIAGLAFLIIKNWDTIKTFFINLWNTVKKAFESFTKWVAGVFGPIIDGIVKAWQGIVNFFTGLWNGVVGIFNGIVGFFQKWGLTILAVIFWPFSLAVGLIITHWETIKSFFAGVWAFIVAVFTPVVQFYATVFGTAWNIIVSIWNAAVGFFVGIWNGIVAIFNQVVGFYARVFGTAWNIIVSIWSAVTGWFAGVWNGIVAIFSPVVNFFANVFRSAWNAITGVFSAVGGFFRGVWNTIVSIFTSVGTSVGNAIGGAVKGVLNSVLSGAAGIINGFIDMINGAVGIINKIPGVNIGKVGRIDVPRFYTGVRNFGGGMAVVGDVRGGGGELVSLPRGSDVYSNNETRKILNSLANGEALGGGGMTFNNYGSIVNETPEASQAFWDRFNRISELATQGVPTNG
jgi:hypothetical protein